MGLVLDASVIVAAERGGKTVRSFFGMSFQRLATGDQRAVLSAIGLTELAHAIWRAQTLSQRRMREHFIQDLLIDVEVVPYTRETAMLAGRIDGEQAARGITIPSVDLLIGATALQVGYSVATANLRHFQLIPGLGVIRL